MKRSGLTFIITAITLAVFFVLTGAFAVGSVQSPRSYWLTERSGETASVTVDLDREYTVTNDDGSEKTEYKNVSAAYVYIGKVYAADENGEIGITLAFKTVNSADTSYVVDKSAKISVEGNSRYNWQKVFDGEDIGYTRVKISTKEGFEFLEVAFTDKDGNIINVKKKVSGDAGGEKIFDEQGSFVSSQSKAYVLSEKEVNELDAADDLFTSGDHVGSPLGTLFNAISVAVFGRNTFGIRFFSLVSGYFALIMLYLLARRLFGSDAYAVCATVSALCAGALFVGSISASGALGTGFVLFAYYNAVGFYTRDRKFADKKATYINILSTGLAIGIAAAFRPTDFIACAGVAVIWALGLKKTAIEYKKEYKEAKGLGKEDVFLAFRSARNTYLWLMPTAFIVLPILAVGATYAAEAGQLASHYGVGWIGAVFCDLARFFTPHYDIFPLAYLLGMDGDKAEFLNYIPCALFAVSFIICTAITATGKFALLKSNIKNKYALITIAFAAALLPVLTGLNDKIAGLAALTCIYSLYLPLALAALEKAWGKKATTGAAIAACALSAVTFAGCYIGLCAFGINDVAAKILYLWQVA